MTVDYTVQPHITENNTLCNQYCVNLNSNTAVTVLFYPGITIVLTSFHGVSFCDCREASLYQCVQLHDNGIAEGAIL
jgi:hypothetical protein